MGPGIITSSARPARFRHLSVHRLVVGAALLFAAAFGLSEHAHGQSASSWNKRGQAAELRQDYDTAYEAYLHAHQKNPKDLRYTTRVDRMRFQAAASHVDRGRLLRQSGDSNGAVNEFTRALQIDPADEAAAQELQVTLHPQLMAPISGGPGGSAGNTAPAGAPGAAVPQDADGMRDLGEVMSPVVLKPISDDPITMHIVEDTKVIYQAIGKAAGLNVLFDPEYNSKRIPVDLNRVSLPDALRIVGLVSKTFFKPVTSDTIYIAANERQNHTNLDDLAVQTFFLSNVSQPNDGNEIQTAVRNLLPADTAKIYFVPSQNALIVRATSDQLLLVQKLLNDLDRPKSEVVVDVAILEVNKDHIRNLGITLPQSFGLTPQSSCTSSSCSTTSSTSSSSSSTTTSSSSSSFTLNTLANLNATNFAVSVSGGTLNALLSDADTRVLQNPSIRATDGQRATLKIGSRIPIATGSYSAGAATGVSAGIGVQTQFQYTDIGVNIDMTPTVHLDRDVSLKMKVEVSSHTSDVTISGVTEPVISQRTIEHTIQLKEGEPSILAGILTKQDNATSSGTPGLGQIPFLKYLFGSQYKEVQQDEVVFVLIPHVVRESLLTRLNTRAIDTGTNGDIQLRRDPNQADALFAAAASPPAAASGTSAANAAAAAVQTLRQQAAPPTPPAAGQPRPATASDAAGTPVTMTLLPAASTQSVGTTFQVAVLATGARDVYSIPLQVQFNPKVLTLVNVDAGGLLGGDGQPVALVHRDEGNGLVTISSSRPPGAPGVNGQGDVCTLTFKAVGAGDSPITLVKVGASNSKQVALPAVGSQAIVHIK
ncbi:MAG: cohesin domain-containing protein [Acidobacteriota bacterium]|nr:cohesin domain-containing protein [Acidobacteriota bacterium]